MRQLGSLFRHLYRFRWSASILLLVLLDFCTYMAFSDTGAPPTFPYQDKVNHLLAFFTLFCMGHISLHFDFFPARRLGGAAVLAHAALWLAYGGFIELGQRFIAARDASLLDLATDGIGILLGYAFVSSADLMPRSADHG